MSARPLFPTDTRDDVHLRGAGHLLPIQSGLERFIDRHATCLDPRGPVVSRWLDLTGPGGRTLHVYLRLGPCMAFLLGPILVIASVTLAKTQHQQVLPLQMHRSGCFRALHRALCDIVARDPALTGIGVENVRNPVLAVALHRYGYRPVDYPPQSWFFARSSLSSVIADPVPPARPAI